MAKKETKVHFGLSEIKTEQFAIFEENHIENGKIDLDTSLTFGLNPEENIFMVSTKYIFEAELKPFLTLQTTCFFKIDDDAIQEFKNENKLIFPKGFVAHMTMITIGTSRGILHTKTEGTPFNKYILPTLNVSKMIKEDVVFD